MSKQTYKVCFCFRRRFRLAAVESPAEIKSLFERYSENGVMTADHLRRFLVEVQREENATVEDAQAISHALKNLNIFHLEGLHLEAFFKYLFSDINPPLNPKVHQDMNCPLSHYFIYTGHNSYLTGNQLSSDCSDVPIIQALHRGVRVIELDIWPNSTRDNVDVLHGRTMTTPVPLITCLRSIKEHAFTASEYPVVITLEDHLTPDLQAKVAQMITQTFGDILFIPGSEVLKEFPSPELMKKRIIISTKPPKEYLEAKEVKREETESEEGSNLPEEEAWGGEVSFRPRIDDDKDSLDEEEADEDEADSKSQQNEAPEYRHLIATHAGKGKGGMKEQLRVDSDKVRHRDLDEEEGNEDEVDDEADSKSQPFEAPQYRHLIAIHAGKGKGGIKDWLRVISDKVRRLSLSELELEKAVVTHGKDIVRFTRTNLLRVYPKGTRFESSNYNPLIAWSHGAQMVAFNMQGYGRFLWLMQGMFRANGGCGYVKKPRILLETGPKDEVFDPKVKLPVKTTLKVTVYIGEGWYHDFRRTHFDAYPPPDFYMRVGIAGVPADTVMKKTRILEDNWLPNWNEEFEFPLTVPELSLLRIEVHEYDMSEQDDFGGQTCLPVWELRKGIRAVPLHSRKGDKYKHVKLLMRFEFV